MKRGIIVAGLESRNRFNRRYELQSGVSNADSNR